MAKLSKIGRQSVIDLFRLPTDNPDLLRAQYDAFSKQIPLLYFILTSTSAALAITYFNKAPTWLSVVFPLLLIGLCLGRLVMWWRRRGLHVSDAQVLKQMQITHKLAGMIAIVFVGWGLLIYPYGDGYARGHVAFFMAITVIGCIFCLMHVRSAALSVTLLVNIPFIIFFFMQPQLSMKSIAVNLAMVSAAMITILFIYYRDFAHLVASRKTLILKQAETQALSDENFRIANLDSLTDLPNRRHFFAELDTHFAEASEKSGFAVGVIDLDGFKPVNDTYGHSTGDKVLVEAGKRLQSVCGDDVFLARLGGDEFGLIISHNPSDERLKQLGAAISDIIRLPFTVGTARALMGCSVGMAVYPRSGDAAEALFERADYALYHAKRHQRGQTVLFSSLHEEQIRTHGVIERALQNADLNAELSMVFQPIVDITTGRVEIFEALARWNSPSLGHVAPCVFIPVAERAGQIKGITRILLKKALAAAKTWPNHIRISFNLSAQDLSDAEGVVHLLALINKSGIDPKRIDFEITETSVTHDFAQAREAVVALKAMGVGISLDDFGTGYSSLSHVHCLPLDKIKVDRSFITDITHNPASVKIVKSLIALCGDMDLACIIEGVETRAQLDVLISMGCTHVQGYYFAKPMSCLDVMAYLRLEAAPYRRSAST
ncbi:MAG: EAL domain-containing protein [Asticcacaulis sp.]